MSGDPVSVFVTRGALRDIESALRGRTTLQGRFQSTTTVYGFELISKFSIVD
jgi:hypothetical protein